MAIGVVAFDPSAEPENLPHPQIIAQSLFNLIALQIRITIFVEETRFTREQRARAVHFNRAAFQNHPRVKNRNIQDFADTGRHNFIEVAGRIFPAPGVVIPIHDGKARLLISR